MIDFIDFGCGIGGSIEWAKAKFGGETHLGIDNRINEIQIATSKGFNVIFGDITSEEIKLPQCRYITMLHFLEHLKNEQQVEKIIEKAMKLANEFIYIKVPFFDATEYLKNLGFRLTWTNWIGHTTNVTAEMLKKIINKFSIQAEIGYLQPILNSKSNEIIPVDAPVDTIVYNELLGEKKYIEFEEVYRETCCLININCQRFEELKKIINYKKVI